MKRLMLLAAAAVLGSGCIVHNNDNCYSPTITVEWSSFLGGDAVARACTQAGVAYVDIYMDRTLVDSWYCTDGGAVITDVPSGTHDLTVEGVESGGRIAYRDEFSVSTASCGDRLVQAQPAEGFVDVNYAFPSGGDCVGSLQDPSYLWFSIYDRVAGATAAEVSERTPSYETTYWCGVYANDPDPLVAKHALFMPLPAGDYTLSWIEERKPTSTVVGASCTPRDFTVPGGSTTLIPSPTLPVVLANTSTACVHP